MFFRFAALVVALGALSLTEMEVSPARAEGTGLEAAKAEALTLLQHRLRPGEAVSAIRDRLLREFETQDLDGGGISESDHRLGEAKAAAHYRAEKLDNLLRHDLDTDGAVSVDELRRSLLPQAQRPLRSAAGTTLMPTPEQVAQTLEDLVQRAQLPDADGDGRATIAEILRAAEAELEARKRPSRHGPIDMAFDLDGDGTVSRREFESVVDAAVSEVDSDGDGVVSGDEIKEFHATLSDIRLRMRERAEAEAERGKLRARLAGCSIPAIPAAAGLVYLGSRHAQREVMLRFAGSDSRVHFADVHVEEGKRPIYLLAASNTPMIVRFSGSVGRLVHVVNIGQATMGFVGIERERAGWFERPDCGLRMPDLRGRIEGTEATGLDYLEMLAGRKPDRVFSGSGLDVISLPSGRHITTTETPGQHESREGLGGAVRKSVPPTRRLGLSVFTLDDVVAPVAVRPYAESD